MKLTEEEKRRRKRSRLIEKACEYQTSTYMRKFVAPKFQKMIRAEAGAIVDCNTVVVVDGELTNVYRRQGDCACVTCGSVHAWDSGIRGMHCGHFLASRRNAILLEENNVAPQCAHCNYYRNGVAEDFRLWMEEVRGPEVIELLQQLKNEVRQFSREELVDLRMEYQDRLDDAIQNMEGARE